MTVEKYVEARYGEPLSAVEYARHMRTFLMNPEYGRGVAYGVRKDTGISPIDH
jgi:hypothetical protein